MDDLKEDFNLDVDPEKKSKFPLKILIPLILIIVLLIGIILFLIFRDKSSESITWELAYEKAEKFLTKFSLEEKISLLFGTENMNGKCCGSIDNITKNNFKGICLQDGPAGVRFSKKTTSWQSSINTASTFNKNLIYLIGKNQGYEFQKKGINIMLGPCLNIMRMPVAGRVWESYGEDPYLTGEIGSIIIKGIQSQNVIACAKHYIGNDQETDRKCSSSNIPEEALWEIYIEPFYKAIKKGDVGSIMESYNAVNGTLLTKNKRLLQDILKDKIGFKGFIMSDWWAVVDNDTNNFNSGLDMNMPGGKYGGKDYIGRNNSFWSDMEKWVNNSEVSVDRIHNAALRIIATMYKLNQIPDKINNNSEYPNVDIDYDTQTNESISLNRRVATDSIVLLKNDDILPINKSNSSIKNIAIIGNDAIDVGCLKIGDCSCINETNKIFQGHLALGYGSGTTSFNYLSDPLTAITKMANSLNITITSSTKLIDGKEDIESGVNIAKESDLSIIFVNADSGEDYIELEQSIGDREDLNVWHNGNELIEKIAEVTSNIIVVINAPSVVNLPWKDKVKGILFAGFLGAESGNAITDILFGNISPSGHLPYVWGKREDYPADVKFNCSRCNIINNNNIEFRQYNYSEGLFVGQRWFDLKNIQPIFPFGFGLSYTQFNFSNLKLNMKKEGLFVSFKVKNVGNFKGSVVGMVFLGFPESVKNYPIRVFKGFEKIELEIKEEKDMEIIIEEHDLSYYNLDKKDFVRPLDGKYKVYVGENARDFVLNDEINANY